MRFDIKLNPCKNCLYFYIPGVICPVSNVCAFRDVKKNPKQTAKYLRKYIKQMLK